MSFGRLGALGRGFGRLGGGGGISGPSIVLSSSTIAEDASVGDLVGTLAVSNGSGSYTFTLDDDAGGKYAPDGVDSSLLEVAAALSVGSDAITVRADNGVDPAFTKPFLITVTAVGGGGGAPTMQFNDAANSQLLAVLEDF